MNQFGVAIHVGAWKQLTDCFRYTSKCCNTYDNLLRFCKTYYINISVNQSQASIYTVLILFSIGYTLAPLTARTTTCGRFIKLSRFDSDSISILEPLPSS